MSSLLHSSAFPEILHQLYFIKYANVAALTITAYDCMITMDDEISLVWPSRWNYTKILYLFNRYSPFIDTALAVHSMSSLTDPKTCEIEYPALAYIYTLGMTVSQAILLIRTYAIWNCNKYILGFHVSLNTGLFLAAIYVLHSVLGTLTYGGFELMQYEACMPSTTTQSIWPMYVLNMTSELVVVVLTMIQLYTSAYRIRAASPIVRTLYRDGLLFYFAMLAMSILNLCLMIAGPPAVSPMMQMPLRAIYSTLCTRVLLNLRKSALKLDAITQHQSTVQFTTRSRLGFEDVDLQCTQTYDSGKLLSNEPTTEFDV
ncbi:hypothetical protein CERSUDRAFT_82218 [Gelatoporia subvermispora B]|uniref:DUF6533 domain-containing protein n=1 Tax=Ceriporiopsis subvermispora (strain B) TaxID=914234 RepID=M2R0I7_CERS8|nr:hypothetical protein CERSUDRAFT_82218 [Gelatoporia subvermispora B]